VPSLDLRFAESKSLVDAVSGQLLITFTRASTGTFVDSDGVIRSAGNDVPRFEHHPTTGECLGLLPEEQRVNSLPNNTMVGAVAGTPGTLPTNWVELSLASGLTRQIVGTGTTVGISYIDIRLSGTTTNANGFNLAFAGNTAVAASTGQSWTASAYCQVVGGSLSNITSAAVRVTERTGAGSFAGSSETAFTNSTGPYGVNRVTATRTLGATAGAVQGNIFLTINSGVAIDITLRIGLPQLEQGAFVTSAIPTTGTAATRTADVVSITGANFSSWYRQDEGCVFVDAFNSAAPIGGAARRLFEFNNNSEAERFFSGFNTTTTLQTLVQDNSVIQANLTQAVPGPVSASKIAASYRLDDLGIVANGGAVSSDTQCTLPTPTQLTIGYSTSGGNSTLNAPIRRLTYWPRRLDNFTLQSITQ
jgi:hypothetical protein